MTQSARPGLFSYRKYWAARFGVAPFLPMSRAEMDCLGWDQCDVILVTGDAYVDHPSFGMAIIGRLLEAQGFRVGILAQPDWREAGPMTALGPPALFFGITAGNMDSMVNRYTADRRRRSDDAYTPNNVPDRRPDRAVIVYAQRCREAYREVPILLGGIEASLRRVAHYDYWSDTVRRSILVDAKADLLVYGNAEGAIVEIAHRTARGEAPRSMTDIRGTALLCAAGSEGRMGDGQMAEGVADGSSLDGPPAAALRQAKAVRLPSFEQVRRDPLLYAHAARLGHLESNPGHARALVQAHGNRDLWINPPPLPLTTAELDAVYALPYARAPHPAYGDATLPAWEMIRFSVTVMRGCFGGCSFCSITAHEGRRIQSRSVDSVLREIEHVRDSTAGFTGIISDLGGPTANLYRLGCRDPRAEAVCRRLSCVYPKICRRLNIDHGPLIALYRRARALPGIKKILIASGLRYDLAVTSPLYVRELAAHHVGGYLKIAPEHTEPGPLAHMMKPGPASFDRFRQLFEQASAAAGKEQYLIPYFMAAHPGTTDEDMLRLALWLKKNGFRPQQVQVFLPTPMALATAMYHSGHSPLQPLRGQGQGKTQGKAIAVPVMRGLKQRRLHKAFLRYHDPANHPVLRDALHRLGRADLIGFGKKHLVRPAARPRVRSKR